MSALNVLSSSINNINDKTNYIVYGFILKIKQKFASTNIPKDIIEICISFYFIPECFEIYDNELINITNNGFTMTNISDEVSTCYVSIEMLSTTNLIHKYKVKINKMRCNNLVIGMDDTNAEYTYGVFYYDEDSNNYGYTASGKKCSRNEVESYGIGCNENDTILTIIDFNKKTISFQINDKDQGIAYKNIQTNEKINYRFAVCTADVDDSVTLLNYECIQQ